MLFRSGDATGTVTDSGTEPVSCIGGTWVFTYTGADQELVVPVGCTQVTFRAWGGGGAGSGVSGFPGGGGGYAGGDLEVAPESVLQILVGAGGLVGSPDPTYGGGGGAGVLSASVNGCVGGSGGGRSAVRIADEEVVTAGGGGGAGD